MSNQQGNQYQGHVTRPLAFSRPLPPCQSHSRGEPIPMPSSSETAKRAGYDITDASSRTIKRIKVSTSTLGLSGNYGASQAHGSPTALPAIPGSAEQPKVHRPIRLSTSNVDPSCISPSQSSSRRSGGGPKAQESDQTQQATKSNDITKLSLASIKTILKHELYHSVYLHTEFFNEFLEADSTVQAQVVQQARNQTGPTRALHPSNYVGYDHTRARWTLSSIITHQRDEKAVYQPLAKALNVIGQAAFDIYRNAHPNDTIRQAYSPFVDHSARETRNDSPSDGAVMPDLLQGRVEDHRVHWGDTELIIECKSSATIKLRGEASMQLCRYARNTFAHQIYRVVVYGFSLCGSIINFVRFDRSGMLHSPDIDLSDPEGAHLFVQHLISLLTLDSRSFGYDTRYSFDSETNPPRTMFKFGQRSPEPVNEILCHRKCICGRATCVTGIGELVLKVIWRPVDRTDEGVTMAGFKGVFGFCQLKDSSCDTYSTKLKYENKLEYSATSQVFTPNSHPTTSTTILRGIRIQSSILMQRGASLFEVQNPLHLVMAIHDALLGIMGFTEVGKLHCDISAYNILLIDPKKHYPDQNWLEQPSFPIKPEVWKETARGSSKAGCVSGGSEAQYDSPRLKRVKELGHGPYCVLHDTEFTVDAKPDCKDDVHPDCTGTPTFISAQLLVANNSIARTFMHDIESLYWVLVWVLIRHTKDPNGPWSVNEHAKRLIQELSDNDLTTLGKYKKAFIKSSTEGDCEKELQMLENPWCEDLIPLIVELGAFLRYYLYTEISRSAFGWEGDAVGVLSRLSAQCLDRQHLQTFDLLFGILGRYIVTLEKKYRVDLTLL